MRKMSRISPGVLGKKGPALRLGAGEPRWRFGSPERFLRLGWGRGGCEVRQEKPGGQWGRDWTKSLAFSGFIAEMRDLCSSRFLRFTGERTVVQQGP